MLEFFLKNKKLIDRRMKFRLNGMKGGLARVNQWGPDLCKRLAEFSASGKTLRGGLVLLSYYLHGGTKKNLPDALDAAVAVELAQSAFLIHDDIMDRDTKRRGKSSFFYQYKETGDRFGFEDSYHFGESLGICAGDAAFFFAYGLLAGLKTPEAPRLTEIFSRELGYVALAQMQDVYAGNLEKSPDGESILKIYLYKTGRYTFSLPILLGAVLAGKTDAEAERAGKIGEKMGVLFQIKDDEIGLFGKEADIGKPVGSDIRENKKNLIRYHLYQLSDKKGRKELDGIFGSRNLTAFQIDTVRSRVINLGVMDVLKKQSEAMEREAEGMIAGLPSAKKEYTDVLLELLRYGRNRKK